MRLRSLVSAVLVSAALTVGIAPAAIAQPQRGLVNVNIEDVLNRNAVGVGVAANVIAEVCGVVVNANVLAEQVVRNGGTFTTTCRAQNNAPVTVTPSTR
jgi:hypothetical protein